MSIFFIGFFCVIVLIASVMMLHQFHQKQFIEKELTLVNGHTIYIYILFNTNVCLYFLMQLEVYVPQKT